MINNQDNKVYIIAEAGVNHNGDKKLAFDLIDAAYEAGADAVKFQIFSADKLASQKVPKANYQLKHTDINENQYQMLKKLELDFNTHIELKNYAFKKNIHYSASAFDASSLKFLMSIDLPFIKIPSGEITNLPLLWKFAKSNSKILLSTGMSTLSDVECALATLTHSLNSDTEPKSIDDIWSFWNDKKSRTKLEKYVSLLHCTSEYPAPFDEINLKAMNTLKTCFNLDIGYSDHSEGIHIAIAAVALGAKIIEKHFTLNRTLPGPDHAASLEPSELKNMVANIRSLQNALGDGIKSVTKSELSTKTIARQQIVAAKNILPGHIFNSDDLTTARCGVGLSPLHYWDLLGKKAPKNYIKGDAIIL